MMKEEKILVQTMGKENHFKVPEGYFEQITDMVMAQLPENETGIINLPQYHSWHSLPLRKMAAAVAVVCLLGGGIMTAIHQRQTHSGNLVSSTTLKQVSNEEDIFNEMANYTMMDNETIYASLVAEN